MICGRGISVVIEVESDIFEARLIGGNSLIVVEAILCVKSLLSIGVNGLRRIGTAIAATGLFFEDIRDCFRRLTVARVMGVVLEIVIFRVDSGVDEEDVRGTRRVNKRSDFVGLIERTVAMSEI